MLEEKYETCVGCASPTYNLNGADECKKCPLTDAFCEGSSILLPSGYWRYNNASDEILACSNLAGNCIGDIDRVESSSIKRTYQNNYCYEGTLFHGVLKKNLKGKMLCAFLA